MCNPIKKLSLDSKPALCKSCKNTTTVNKLVFIDKKVLCKNCAISDMCFEINALSASLEGKQKEQLLGIKKLALNLSVDLDGE